MWKTCCLTSATTGFSRVLGLNFALAIRFVVTRSRSPNFAHSSMLHLHCSSHQSRSFAETRAPTFGRSTGVPVTKGGIHTGRARHQETLSDFLLKLIAIPRTFFGASAICIRRIARRPDFFITSRHDVPGANAEDSAGGLQTTRRWRTDTSESRPMTHWKLPSRRKSRGNRATDTRKASREADPGGSTPATPRGPLSRTIPNRHYRPTPAIQKAETICAERLLTSAEADLHGS